MSRRKIWNFTPALPIKTAPYFDWPLRPLVSALYLLRSWNPVGWRCMTLIAAVITWVFFTPDISQAHSLSLAWIGPIWMRNFVLLFALAGGLHLWLHSFARQGDRERYDLRPMGRGVRAFHFNHQVWDNMLWSFVALQFWTFWECLIYWAWANGYATRISFETHPVWFLSLILLLPIWAGLHFYWLHRALHTRLLYRRVHAWHHKNINTGPWSGLAMHPVESFFLMFDTMIFFILPAHPIHVIFLLFHHGIGAPVSHAGFESLKLGRTRLPLGDFFHQLHHKFFDCNYGTWETPWDEWFNTFHDGTDDGNHLITERRKTLLRSEKSP